MKRAQCKAFARSTGAQCQAKAVPGKTVCRIHGGASDGAPKENQHATKHGIYGKFLTDEEKGDFDAVTARIGTLDAEITLLRFRMRRALDAEAKAFESDKDGLEVVQRHDREASEFGPGDETVRKRVDYGEHVERIARRVESLERTRAELAKLARENPDADDSPVTEIAVHVVTAENVHLYRDEGNDEEA